MEVAHAHKIPLVVDNTFGMGGMRTRSHLGGVMPDGRNCQVTYFVPSSMARILSCIARPNGSVVMVLPSLA